MGDEAGTPLKRQPLGLVRKERPGLLLEPLHQWNRNIVMTDMRNPVKQSNINPYFPSSYRMSSGGSETSGVLSQYISIHRWVFTNIFSVPDTKLFPSEKYPEMY
jgi:hypothetical protein